MNEADLTTCLELLETADRLLIGSGELLLAAQLMAVIEPLAMRARVMGVRPPSDAATPAWPARGPGIGSTRPR